MKLSHTILTKAGLNKSETTVYLAGKQLGDVSSGELIRNVKLPRQTVLSALRGLQEYGLCLFKRRDGRSYIYAMQEISAITSHLGRRIRVVEALIDNIEKLPAEDLNQTTITDGIGSQQLQDHLERALRCSSRQWRIIAPRDNALRYLPANYVNYFKRVRSERQISSQTLWEHTFSDQTISLIDTLMRKPRYIPKNSTKHIPAILLSFDDSLLFISGKEKASSTLITNRDVVATYTIIFDLAWQTCRESSKG